ncbi:hypothetical protein DPMN_043113 [Dreissena polymorpha]|uniref:C2H2-type domain-containing protein n=1 Tax=Dreissena polymorpha TaxID=45954 RepID=A0A9D4D1Q9_DREPO|nr:hypothetical protein DPMN_043113 [Dreissena polymorpha]
MDFTNDLSFFGFAVIEQEQESFVVSSETDRNEHNVESGDQADNLLFDCNNNEKATEQPLDLKCSVEIVVDNKKKHECNMCVNKYSTRTGYKRHLVSHSNDGQKCTVCEKVFYSTYDLKNHMSNHSNLRTFSCIECEKTFKTKRDLNVHRTRLHKSYLKFVCEVCGKGYNYRNELDGHRAKHDGSKPFKCPKCNKAYQYLPNLSRHVCGKMESPKCDKCGSIFKTKHYLQEHMKAHDDPEQHQCYVCGTFYKYRSSF